MVSTDGEMSATNERSRIEEGQGGSGGKGKGVAGRVGGEGKLSWI